MSAFVQPFRELTAICQTPIPQLSSLQQLCMMTTVTLGTQLDAGGATMGFPNEKHRSWGTCASPSGRPDVRRSAGLMASFCPPRLREKTLPSGDDMLQGHQLPNVIHPSLG